MRRITTTLGALAALGGACIVWAHGMLAGKLLLLRPAYEICGFKRTDEHEYIGTWFPPRSVCIRGNGSRFDLVPSYVNPLTLALLVTAAVLTVNAVLAHRRNRTTN